MKSRATRQVLNARLVAISARSIAKKAEAEARKIAPDPLDHSEQASDAWFAAWEARDASRRSAASVRMAKYYAKRNDAYQTSIAVDMALAAAVTTTIAYARILMQSDDI